MGNIVQLKPSVDIPQTLRSIASDIENGIITTDSVTLIAVPNIYQIGTFNDNDAVTETIFNCTFAIHKLMNAAMDISE